MRRSAEAIRGLAVALMMVALLAACEENEELSSPNPSQASPTVVDPPAAPIGPGISIEEALEGDVEEPVLVNGALLGEGGVVRLCSGLAESLPPLCVEPSLEVTGIDLADYPTKEAQGVTFTDEPVQVLGELTDGTLHASSEGIG